MDGQGVVGTLHMSLYPFTPVFLSARHLLGTADCENKETSNRNHRSCGNFAYLSFSLLPANVCLHHSVHRFFFLLPVDFPPKNPEDCESHDRSDLNYRRRHRSVCSLSHRHHRHRRCCHRHHTHPQHHYSDDDDDPPHHQYRRRRCCRRY